MAIRRCFFSAMAIFLQFALHAEDITGFWKTIDDETNKPRSIVAIYAYDNQYFGRLVATYNERGEINDDLYHPKERAEGIVGNPYYSGLDILLNLKKSDKKYTKGKIVDPEKGRIYEAEAWMDKGNLVVRGELFIFGKNQTWPPALESDFPQGFVKPDLKQLVPVIPKLKEE